MNDLLDFRQWQCIHVMIWETQLKHVSPDQLKQIVNLLFNWSGLTCFNSVSHIITWTHCHCQKSNFHWHAALSSYLFLNYFGQFQILLSIKFVILIFQFEPRNLLVKIQKDQSMNQWEHDRSFLWCYVPPLDKLWEMNLAISQHFLQLSLDVPTLQLHLLKIL